MDDAAPDIEKRLVLMMAAKSPAERLRMASDMLETGRALAQIGITRQFPSITKAQLRGQMFLRMYRDDFTEAECMRIAEIMPGITLEIDR